MQNVAEQLDRSQDLRAILRDLRDVMASSDSFQNKLEAIVLLVAQGLGADVCSLYVRRLGDILELYAAHGLKPDAVGQTRLMIGQGLVGRIALEGVPQVFSNAPKHKDWAHKPLTGADLYPSFLGVPLLKDHKVMGVLVLQNKDKRKYTQNDSETLETIAMVVAEILSHTDIHENYSVSSYTHFAHPQRIEGTVIAPGIRIAHAFFHRPQIKVRKTVADDPVFEKKRFREALKHVIYTIENLLSDKGVPTAANDVDFKNILEAYHLFSSDPVWVKKVEKSIEAGLTADAAVAHIRQDIQKRLKRVKDAFFKERLREFEEITNRLLLHLSGKTIEDPGAYDKDFILVAESLTPAEFLAYNRETLKGLILSDIAPTSHVTILAKTLDIPIVQIDATHFAHIDELHTMVIDGNVGQILVRPSADILESFKRIIETQQKRKAMLDEYRQHEALTKDGQKMHMMLNAAILADMVDLDASGAMGIGLYRTEIPFIVHSTFPTIEQQVKVYRRAFDYAGDKPLYFRTLDIGGDKFLPYMRYKQKEQNPALGWRGMRILVDCPGLLRKQLRAILEAGAGRHVWIMFPMITTSSEFFMARDLLNHELTALKKAKKPVPLSVKKGVLLEIPSLYFELDYLLPHVDFISLGTNDFFQFLYGCDRSNTAMSTRYHFLSPAMLRMCQDLVKKCQDHGVMLSTCGDKCGNPIDGLVLAGLGFRYLSMPSSQIGLMKAVFSKVNLKDFENFLKNILQNYSNHYDEHIRHYMRDHDIPMMI